MIVDVYATEMKGQWCARIKSGLGSAQKRKNGIFVQLSKCGNHYPSAATNCVCSCSFLVRYKKEGVVSQLTFTSFLKNAGNESRENILSPSKTNQLRGDSGVFFWYVQWFIWFVKSVILCSKWLFEFFKCSCGNTRIFTSNLRWIGVKREACLRVL